MPRFYLTLFSADGICINLFNFRSSRQILAGNLRNQCYRNYFYGKELALESGLGKIEGLAAELIRKTIEKGTLPPRMSSEHLAFSFYILLQYARTLYSAEALDESLDGMWKQVLKHCDGVSPEMLAGVRIAHSDPAAASIGYTAQMYPFILDLEWKLLEAGSMQEFITSDNPVVFYNQLMSFRRHGSATGIACKELQIFFPLSPKYVLLMYDSKVYSVGHKSSGRTDGLTKSDVDQLNILQAAAALDNIYFLTSRSDFHRVAERGERFRRAKR